MHGDHEIWEPTSGKPVILTRRLAIANDEQVRFLPTLNVAMKFVGNALSDFRNKDTLKKIVIESTGNKYLGKTLRDEIIKEVVANEIAIKTYRVVEKKPKKWGKAT